MSRSRGTTPKKPRRKWDAYRRIAVWLGVLLPVSILLYPLIAGSALFSGEPTTASTNVAVALMVFPALFSGAASGARFFAVYAGYAQRLDPTDTLSEEDGARGAAAAYGPVGDWLWSSLVASASGGLVLAVTVGMEQEHDALGIAVFSVILFPMLVFTLALGWALGAIIGTGASVLLCSSLGALVGLRHRRDRHGTVAWVLISVLLALLLVWAICYGLSLAGMHGGAVAWVGGIAFVLGGVVVVALIAIGTPPLLSRIRTGDDTIAAGGSRGSAD